MDMVLGVLGACLPDALRAEAINPCTGVPGVLLTVTSGTGVGVPGVFPTWRGTGV